MAYWLLLNNFHLPIQMKSQAIKNKRSLIVMSFLDKKKKLVMNNYECIIYILSVYC